MRELRLKRFFFDLSYRFVQPLILDSLTQNSQGISFVFLKYLEERSFESLVFANGLRIILK
jgi:hypothetical protein